MLEEEEIIKLVRIRRTVMQMLRDRGYLATDDEINLPRADFFKKFGDEFKRADLFIHKTNPNDNSDQIFVFFPDDPKVGVKHLRTYIDRMKAEYVYRAILVAQRPLTPSAKHAIKEVSSKFQIEEFQDNKYAKDLLNVPLEQYEELKLVCGDDQATGSYGKSFSDMPNDEDVGVEETSETHELSTGPTSDSSVPKGGRGKRSRPWEDAFSKIDALSVQISRLTDAFVSSDQNFCDQVFGEVMKTEGFDEDILTKAFEYLTENPLKGRQFIAKRPNMRKDWMKTFATNS